MEAKFQNTIANKTKNFQFFLMSDGIVAVTLRS